MASHLSTLGFDWLCLDAQHGSHDDRSILATLALCAPQASVLVRVRKNDAGLIGRALDAGASGVVVPQVDSAQDARRAVESCFYPPQGRRSWGPIRSDYGTAAKPDERNTAVRCAVMIESAEALAVVDEIAAVVGVGMLFVGPFDLALALGRDLNQLLDEDDPAGPLPRIVAAAAAAGLECGAFAGTPKRAVRLRALGFTAVAVATDRVLLRHGAEAALA